MAPENAGTLPPGSSTDEQERPHRRTLWPLLVRNLTSVAALLTLLISAALAALAPLDAPYNPLAIDPTNMLSAPSAMHLMGTDELGRDIFSRVIYGGRVSLGVAIVVVVASASIGILLGLAAGYYGGVLDLVVSRLIDVILAFPAILLAMGLIALLGTGTINAAVAVTVVSIPSFARLARASALQEKEKEYVEAARALGASHGWILRYAILPNSAGPLAVQAGVTATTAILLEAALSFLGLGTSPPTPSWGQMLNTSRDYLYQAWWYGFFPGLSLTLVVLSLNRLADTAQHVAAWGWRRL